MKDIRIINLYFQRNEQAIAETDKKYGRYCSAVANNILNDPEDSKECVNDTWLRAWNCIPPKKPDNLKIFLARITRNFAFNRYEKRNAKKRVRDETAVVLDELEECISGDSDTEAETDMRELKKIINDFVISLPKKEADIFIRRYFFTEPLKSVAIHCGITENNAAVILCRIRKKLKKHLEQEDYSI